MTESKQREMGKPTTTASPDRRQPIDKPTTTASPDDRNIAEASPRTRGGRSRGRKRTGGARTQTREAMKLVLIERDRAKKI